MIHTRPRFYAGFPDQAQQLFSKLSDLCASERGRRVKIVQHREDNRMLRRGGAEAVGRTGEGLLFPIQQEINTRLRYERFIWLIEYVFFAYSMNLLLFLANLASSFQFKPFGYLVGPSAYRVPVPHSYVLGLVWRPVRATLIGKRDHIGIILGTCMVSVPSLVVRASKFFVLYLGLCLA